MKKRLPDKVEEGRIAGPNWSDTGFFVVKRGSAKLRIRSSSGGGWDHVSVSLATRCPTWAEMSYVKELFFEPEETAMQLHPPRSEWINNHPYCLHLWRPQSQDEIAQIRQQWLEEGEEWPYGDLESPGSIPRPPGSMVGIQDMT